MSSKFAVEQIDHVELFVPDPREAAAWFERTLGLRIVEWSRRWLEQGGPLMVSSDGGKTMLALFAGEARGRRETAGHHRVAFRVSGDSFLAFLDHIREFPVFSDDGAPLGSLKISDHSRSFSVYFCDPYGNRFEVTTYDTDRVRPFAGG